MIIKFDPYRRWEERALCRTVPDGGFFTPTDPTNPKKKPGEEVQERWNAAKRFCFLCPVLDECRRDTLGEDYGVWGGLDQVQRHYRRQRLSLRVRKRLDPAEKLELAQQISALRRDPETGRDRLPVTEIRRLTGLSQDAIMDLIQFLNASHLAVVDGEAEDRPSPKANRLLSSQARQAIITLREQGHSHRSIARQIGCSTAAVHGTLKRHRERLAEGSAVVAFPGKPGRWDGWVRRENRIFDCTYMAETEDGAFLLMRIRSGLRGGHSTRWFPAHDVKLHHPVARVVKEYRGYAKAQAQSRVGESKGGGDGEPSAEGGALAPDGAPQSCCGTSAPYWEVSLVHVIEVKDGELMAAIARQCDALGVRHGAIVSLLGAVDGFTVSTMPAEDATKDIVTSYDLPAEMTGTGEIVDGTVHVHAVLAVEGDRAIAGHLHRAHVGTWFARAYVVPV